MKYLNLILLVIGLQSQAKEFACSAIGVDRNGVDPENSCYTLGSMIHIDTETMRYEYSSKYNMASTSCTAPGEGEFFVGYMTTLDRKIFKPDSELKDSDLILEGDTLTYKKAAYSYQLKCIDANPIPIRDPELDNYTAKCRMPESSFTSEVFRFYSPFGNSFALIGENGGSERIPSSFRLSTWITYTASFIYNGQNVSATFSNYESPSVGTMRFPDGQTKFLACQLNGYK